MGRGLGVWSQKFPLAVTLKLVSKSRKNVKKWSLRVARTGPVPESGPMSLRVAKVVFKSRQTRPGFQGFQVT